MRTYIYLNMLIQANIIMYTQTCYHISQNKGSNTHLLFIYMSDKYIDLYIGE